MAAADTAVPGTVTEHNAAQRSRSISGSSDKKTLDLARTGMLVGTPTPTAWGKTMTTSQDLQTYIETRPSETASPSYPAKAGQTHPQISLVTNGLAAAITAIVKGNQLRFAHTRKGYLSSR